MCLFLFFWKPQQTKLWLWLFTQKFCFLFSFFSWLFLCACTFLNEMPWHSSSPVAVLWGPTLCTAIATCSGCLTGWRAATRSRASPDAQGRVTWPTSCFSPRLPRSSPAQVNAHTFNAMCTKFTNVSIPNLGRLQVPVFKPVAVH